MCSRVGLLKSWSFMCERERKIERSTSTGCLLWTQVNSYKDDKEHLNGPLIPWSSKLMNVGSRPYFWALTDFHQPVASGKPEKVNILKSSRLSLNTLNRFRFRPIKFNMKWNGFSLLINPKGTLSCPLRCVYMMRMVIQSGPSNFWWGPLGGPDETWSTQQSDAYWPSLHGNVVKTTVVPVLGRFKMGIESFDQIMI